MYMSPFGGDGSDIEFIKKHGLQGVGAEDQGEINPAGPKPTAPAASYQNPGAMMPTAPVAPVAPQGSGTPSPGAWLPKPAGQEASAFLRTPSAREQSMQDYLRQNGGNGAQSYETKVVGQDANGQNVFARTEDLVGRQNRLSKQFLDMEAMNGADADRNLQAYLGVGGLADRSRMAGVAERGATTAEKALEDSMRKTDYTINGGGMREQAKLAGLATQLKGVEAGQIPDPKTIKAISDLVDGAVPPRAAPTPGPGGPTIDPPPASTAGTDAMGRLIGKDPQLAHKVGLPKQSAHEKVTILLQQRGSEWVKANWPAIQAALAESDPHALDSLRDESKTSLFSSTVQAPGAWLMSYLKHPLASPAERSKSLREDLTRPVGESWRSLTGENTQSDRTNAFLRYVMQGSK